MEIQKLIYKTVFVQALHIHEGQRCNLTSLKSVQFTLFLHIDLLIWVK